MSSEERELLERIAARLDVIETKVDAVEAKVEQIVALPKAVKQTTASKLLDCGIKTVKGMIASGQLRTATVGGREHVLMQDLVRMTAVAPTSPRPLSAPTIRPHPSRSARAKREAEKARDLLKKLR